MNNEDIIYSMDGNAKAGTVFLALGIANAVMAARNMLGDGYGSPSIVLHSVIASMLIVGALLFFRECRIDVTKA